MKNADTQSDTSACKRAVFLLMLPTKRLNLDFKNLKEII